MIESSANALSKAEGDTDSGGKIAERLGNYYVKA
jgi:hypothetical protein